MGNIPEATKPDLVSNLCNLINSVSEGKLEIPLEKADIPLNEQGINSVMLLSFLVAIEDNYMMEWSPDVPQPVFTSIETIAEYLKNEQYQKI